VIVFAPVIEIAFECVNERVRRWWVKTTDRCKWLGHESCNNVPDQGSLDISMYMRVWECELWNGCDIGVVRSAMRWMDEGATVTGYESKHELFGPHFVRIVVSPLLVYASDALIDDVHGRQLDVLLSQRSAVPSDEVNRCGERRLMMVMMLMKMMKTERRRG